MHENRHAKIEPQWVMIEGEVRRVSEFAEVPPPKRPRATCPLCCQRVVMKLGRVKAHHYAHHRETKCKATTPEGALHLNTKYHILHELQKGHEVWVEQECSDDRCKNTQRHLWASNWDCVRDEFRHDRYRFDLAILRQNELIGVLEVWATHEVGAEKAEFLDAQPYPWLEFRASPEIYEGEDAWTCERPFPAPSWHLPYAKWTCPTCIERNREEEEEQEKWHQKQIEQRLQAQRDSALAQRRWEQQQEKKSRGNANNNAEDKSAYIGDIHAVLIVDCYFRDGRSSREPILLMKQISQAQWVRAWVHVRGVPARFVKPIVATPSEALGNSTWRSLKFAVENHLTKMQEQGTIVDIVHDWELYKNLSHSALSDKHQKTQRFKWHPSRQQWLLEGHIPIEELESDRFYGLRNARFKRRPTQE